MEEGDLAEVFSAGGEKLGTATLSRGRSILASMLSFGEEKVTEAIRRKIQEAILLRQNWFQKEKTNAIRLVNAEGDGLPGLIVDAYHDVWVMQVSNGGMEGLKGTIIETLLEYKPKSLFERSGSFLRRKEGMGEVKGHLYGDPCSEVEVLENGLMFFVDVLQGQKTGMFLDQREMRSLVQSLAPGKKVLNCFAYTAGFSVAALAGGAISAVSVEQSAKCAPWIEKNLSLNSLSNHTLVTGDVFEYLKACNWDFDLVILDPPAFVKKRDDIANAFRAYKELNRAVLEKIKPNSLLLTSSCSYHVDESLFQNILFRAALEANRSVRILERHRQAHDHPISIFHPESSYLKSFLLSIA